MPIDPMNPMPALDAEQPHDERAPVAASPADAVDEAMEEQLLQLFRDESMDPKAKLKALGELMKKHAKIRELIGGDEEDDQCGDDDDVEACHIRRHGIGACHQPDAPRTVSASRSPDPMLVKLAAENYGMKLDQLVASRKITPAVAGKLKAQYIGPSAQALALSLSRGPDGTAHLDGLILALGENAPMPELGERSAAQGFTLGNPYRDPAADPETRSAIEFMYEQVGGKAK